VLSSLVGTGGTFKSSLAIAEAVCMATGKPVLGVPIKRPLRVHIHSAEDPINLVVDRANAFLKQHGPTGAELGDRLTVSTTSICRIPSSATARTCCASRQRQRSWWTKSCSRLTRKSPGRMAMRHEMAAASTLWFALTQSASFKK
jgi:hypothetical protein